MTDEQHIRELYARLDAVKDQRDALRAERDRLANALQWAANELPGDKCECECCRLTASTVTNALAGKDVP